MFQQHPAPPLTTTTFSNANAPTMDSLTSNALNLFPATSTPQQAELPRPDCATTPSSTHEQTQDEPRGRRAPPASKLRNDAGGGNAGGRAPRAAGETRGTLPDPTPGRVTSPAFDFERNPRPVALPNQARRHWRRNAASRFERASAPHLLYLIKSYLCSCITMNKHYHHNEHSNYGGGAQTDQQDNIVPYDNYARLDKNHTQYPNRLPTIFYFSYLCMHKSSQALKVHHY